MSNFIFSLNVTIPVFLMILIGFFLRKFNLIGEKFVSDANKYVFKCALPVMLFKDIAESDILKNANIKFILFCMCVTILMFSVVWIFSYIFIKDKSLVGAFAQGASRGSAAILGVAFVENICGNAGMAPLMIVAAVPFFNILSVIILTFSAEFDQKNKSRTIRIHKFGIIKKSLVQIVKNPIIIGIFLGMPFAFFKIPIYTIPDKVIGYIAQTATPIALIAIGGGFDKTEAVTRIKTALAASIIKLIILPAVFLPFAALFDFNSSEVAAILIMLASPTTVSCYIMAKNMDNDGPLTSDIIMITTVLSSLTLTGWIFILKTVSLI